jgi:hypothetical protein
MPMKTAKPCDAVDTYARVWGVGGEYVAICIHPPCDTLWMMHNIRVSLWSWFDAWHGLRRACEVVNAP